MSTYYFGNPIPPLQIITMLTYGQSVLVIGQLYIFNNYLVKSQRILPDTEPMRLEANLAKIRCYFARLSRIIIVLLFIKKKEEI